MIGLPEEDSGLQRVGPGAASDSDSGCILIGRQPISDERGIFERLFAVDELARAGINAEAVHINLTRTAQPGTVKGFHLQMSPQAETKIITCIVGRIFDVAVDLRAGSSTYGQWLGIELSPDVPQSLLIPEGFAHGMQCLEPDSIVHYVHSVAYAPTAEAGVHPLDSELGVPWPLPPQHLSLRDQSLPRLADFGKVS